MRISAVLSSSDLPTEELQVGVLDGELMRVGGAFCAVDTIVVCEHRARAVAVEVPKYAIAERLTAAWIYGALGVQPHRLQLCVTIAANIRPLSSARCVFREVVISDSEILEIGGFPVTTPLRTALDLARIDVEFSNSTADVIRYLATLGQGFSIVDCHSAISSRRNLPNKRLALDRLSDTLSNIRRTQPALTR